LACWDARRGYRVVADRPTTVDRSAGPARPARGGTFRAAPAARGATRVLGESGGEHVTP